MKLKVTEDVDAPLGPVWESFTDFDGLEAEVRGRGVELTRVGNWSEPREGAEWRGAVNIRGKRRAIQSTIMRLVHEDLYVIDNRIGGMDCHYEMSFVALAPEVTRVGMVLDLSADTLTARLILQTMKLARGRVMTRLQGVLARQGNAAEAEWRRSRR